MTFYPSGRCDCCEGESDGLVSGDGGESWVCPTCRDALMAVAERDQLRDDMAKVRKFIDERAEYMQACRANTDGGPDYYRWLGNAIARRNLAESLGVDFPGGWL